MKGNLFRTNTAALILTAVGVGIQYQSLRVQQFLASHATAEERLKLVAEKEELERQKLLFAEEKAKFNEEMADKISKGVSEGVQKITNNNNPADLDIKESGVFDFFSGTLSNFVDYIASLDFFHSYALLNILTFTALCLCLMHLFFLFFSDFYITLFKLEVRFPKLVSIIKARKLITTGSVLVYTIALIMLLVFGVVVNAAFFLL